MSCTVVSAATAYETGVFKKDWCPCAATCAAKLSPVDTIGKPARKSYVSAP